MIYNYYIIIYSYLFLVLVNEDNRSPNGLVVTHLPDGPTASFRLRFVVVVHHVTIVASGHGLTRGIYYTKYYSGGVYTPVGGLKKF